MRSAGNFGSEWGYLAPAPSFMRTARIVLVATAVGATAGAGVVLSLVDHPAAEGSQTSVAAHAIVTSVQAATPATMPLASAEPATAVAPVNVAPAAENVPPTAKVQVPVQAAVQPPAQGVPQPQAQTPVKTPPVIATQSPEIQSPQPSAAQPSASSGLARSIATGDASAVASPPSPPGIASLSEMPVANEVPSSGVLDETVAPTAMAPLKKTSKHHSTAPAAADAKNPPRPGLGSVLRRLFSARAGTSYYPN
jgi:hypothetical protein